MSLELLAEGELRADGSEQTLIRVEYISKIMGYVSLSSIEEGDEVVIRQYFKIGNVYLLYEEETYTGDNIEPLVYITPKEGDGIKVTLQQTKGSYKVFPYKFFEVKAKASFTV